MKFVITKDIPKQIKGLYKRGGQYQKAAEQIKALIGDINLGDDSPFEKLNRTKHGETRIKKCIKYDLSRFCRLVTIQDNGITTLAYLGTHNECEKWLDSNKGIQLAIDKKTNEVKKVLKSIDLTNPTQRIKDDSDYSEGTLISKLNKSQVIFISDLISGARYMPFIEFDSLTDEDTILDYCTQIEDNEISELYFDVFMAIKSGKIDEAKNRILQYKEEIILVEKANQDLIRDTISNDEYLILDDFEKRDIELILNNSDWHDWMLFMHPAQRNVVDNDFKGTARLLGVSGSGKTSVIVNRAIRLAKKYPKERILILTLNRALAKLIQELIKYALGIEKDKSIISYIEVKSFWKLSQELLIEFEPNNLKIYNDLTHKNLEDIEEIWDEFYHCEANNFDAEILRPVHKSLLARGLFPSTYIKQEFNWIRSLIIDNEREKYLKIEREGRKFNFIPEHRKLILKGLSAWEEKMKFIGISDYMGLVKPMYKHLSKIEPKYRCILVDELQDFGTSELHIIRKLVKEDTNDIFLSGDIAQQVNTKQHKIVEAGIKILPDNYIKIMKNYRNSREILESAYSVFINNTTESSYNNQDFELIKPEYANFTSPKPFIRECESINQEFSYALKYLKNELGDRSKGCIAFSGYGYYDVNKIGLKHGLSVLNGKSDLSESNIFISDLEQTKGFEFDTMIIINANQDVIPSPDLPKDEWYREISKIYVAMTRAKTELIISYSRVLSEIFKQSIELFNLTDWGDYFEHDEIVKIIEVPSPRSITVDNLIMNMTGIEFLYTKKAIGLSPECQDKILNTVTGKKSSLGGKDIEWRDMNELKMIFKSKRSTPYLNKLFGRRVFGEINRLFDIK